MAAPDTHSDDFADVPDVLARANLYASMLRASPAPAECLAELLRHFAQATQADPPYVSLPRLAAGCADQHKSIIAFLRERRRTTLLNRPPSAAPTAPAASEEALRLAALVQNPATEGIVLFPDAPAYSLFSRAVSCFAEDLFDFPPDTRLLVTYPLSTPQVFPVSCRCDYASVADAVADAYTTIYSAPERFGVRGHDLSNLVLEKVWYIAEERLLYPSIGS